MLSFNIPLTFTPSRKPFTPYYIYKGRAPWCCSGGGGVLLFFRFRGSKVQRFKRFRKAQAAGSGRLVAWWGAALCSCPFVIWSPGGGAALLPLLFVSLFVFCLFVLCTWSR